MNLSSSLSTVDTIWPCGIVGYMLLLSHVNRGRDRNIEPRARRCHGSASTPDAAPHHLAPAHPRCASIRVCGRATLENPQYHRAPSHHLHLPKTNHGAIRPVHSRRPYSDFVIRYHLLRSVGCLAVTNHLLTATLDPEDSLETLFDKLSKKTVSELNGRHVRPGWVKYEWNSTVWNMDDGTLTGDFTHALSNTCSWQHPTTPYSRGG